jgi:hypothetical protein
MTLLNPFVDRVRLSRSAPAWPPRGLGDVACIDPALLLDLRAGRSPHDHSINKVEALMAEHFAAAPPALETQAQRAA